MIVSGVKTSSAALVKELRERTGGGLLECKKALDEAGGDIEKAIEAMRKSGMAKAAKKAGRIAAEGIVLNKISSDFKKGIVIEFNSETDFVARGEDFVNFTNKVATRALDLNCDSIEKIGQVKIANDSAKTVTEELDALVAKIGEKIVIRRLAFMQESTGIVCGYSHGSKISVLLRLSVDNKELGKDIAMHIAALKPQVILPEELPKEILDKEREIYLSQVESSGKPPEILKKMVEGKLQKFINEVTLLKQPFVKDSEVTIENLLKKSNAKVLEFKRFEVGEGIEKKEVDFRAEVMAQVEK